MELEKKPYLFRKYHVRILCAYAHVATLTMTV